METYNVGVREDINRKYDVLYLLAGCQCSVWGILVRQDSSHCTGTLVSGISYY